MRSVRETQFAGTMAVVVMLCLVGSATGATYGGGSGTAADPYQIWTAEQMNAIGAEPNDWDKHFKLMADIDLSAYDGQEGRPAFNIIAADVDSQDPTSRRDIFTGVFDGDCHTIANFTLVSASEYRSGGLFGYVGAPSSEIRNLGLVNAAVQVGDGWYVGTLAGVNLGVILHCYSTGSVEAGRDCIGGLIGYNYGAMVGCYSEVAVNGDGVNAGGLVGMNDEGAIIHCYSTGSVTAQSDVGGLVGDNWEGDLIHCYSTGLVKSTKGSAGGLAGRSTHSMEMDDVAVSCFWDVRTSGQTKSAVGMGLTTDRMQDKQTFVQAGWDWVDTMEDGTSNTWRMPDGGGYPILAFFRDGAPSRLRGTGTSGDPYLISNAFELGAMASYSPGAHYRLSAPIDLFGIRWCTAPVPCLSGTFDGGGLTISHLTLAGDSHLGLFGRLRYEAQIANLGTVDVNIAGEGSYNAGLVARNEGVVIRCFSTGRVGGDLHAGGLVGINEGVVADCHSNAAVRGRGACGRLLGWNSGSLTHCYSVGLVEIDGIPENRLVGSGDNGFGCFGEVQGSASRRGEDRQPQTRVDLCDKETYLDAGWDWIGETANGTSQVWQMPEDGGYPVVAIFNGYAPPRLQGQGTPDDPYRVSNALELGAMTYYSPSAHYRLKAPIDLSGIRWAVPIVASFRGAFDGSGLAISHLTIAGGGYLGLFGRLSRAAEVRDLGVVDCNIAGSRGYVGTLAGMNAGTARRCYSTGEIHSTGHSSGGLMGYSWGDVIQCFSACQVTAGMSVGGLLGLNSGFVSDCYSLGNVQGEDSVGGLVGSNLHAVIRCYSAGAVESTDGWPGGLCGFYLSSSETVDGFWDIQVSGCTTSGGGAGRTTVELKTAAMFLDAGWDFIGETANGIEDIWWIDEGQDYPRLWWEPDQK